MNWWKKSWAYVIMGVVIIGLGAVCAVMGARQTELERHLSYVYDSALISLQDDMATLDDRIDKVSVSAQAATQSALLDEVWSHADSAADTLSRLPMTVADSGELTSFLNQTGDYCRMLSLHVARGGNITAADYEALEQMAAAAREVAIGIRTAGEGYVPNVDLTAQTFYSADSQPFVSADYPRLQYDGPFSEATLERAPKSSLGEEVDATAAMDAAKTFIGESRVSSIVQKEDTAGAIPCYVFEGRCSYGEYTIEVTKAGGHVLRYRVYGSDSASAVPTDEKYAQLVNRARIFLRSKGLGEFEAGYAQFYGGSAVISLAPVQDGAVIYPQLIKVWVDVAVEEVRGVDAYNYYMAKRTRTIGKPTLTEEEARRSVSKRLTIESAQLALIPKDDNTERLCYEFKCKRGGSDYLVYINVFDGTEEEVLKVIHTNEGVLTM